MLCIATSFAQKMKYVYTIPAVNTVVTQRIMPGQPIWIESINQMIDAKTELVSGSTIPVTWYNEFPATLWTVPTTIDSAGVWNLNTVDTLVQAPGEGYCIMIEKVYAYIDVEDTLEVGSQVLNIKLGGTSLFVIPNADLENAASKMVAANNIDAVTTANFDPNKPVTVVLSGAAAPTKGSATIKFFIAYRKFKYT